MRGLPWETEHSTSLLLRCLCLIAAVGKRGVVPLTAGSFTDYFIIFMMITRTGFGMRISPRQVKRRHDYRKEVKKAKPMSVAKHKCAICGRTSDEYPDLEFRFCSKCNGNYEYCQDHLFTHTHVQ